MGLKRKAEKLAQTSPGALEPNSVTRQPKVKPVVSLSAPKRLTFADTVQNASAIACIAAAKCGCDEGQMAAIIAQIALLC